MTKLPKLAKPYQREKCGDCGQYSTYLLSVDRGTLDIVRAIAMAEKRKGVCAIHPRKELEVSGMDYAEMYRRGLLTSNQVGNLKRPNAHELIAKVPKECGNYYVTKKGFNFLKGADIPRFAIMSKTEKRQIGYYLADEYAVNVKDLLRSGEYWEGIDYEIVEGRVITAQEFEKK